MGNMSPQQMQNNLNMMNPEMMKNASNMIAGMSDSQIQMYLAQMGMSGIDPSMFRNMCQNMSNMSDSQFNNMKNMAQANINNMANNANANNTNNNSNNNNNQSNKGIVQDITKIKEEGNTLFRNNKYEEAIKKYYEALEEIKTTIDKDKYKNELDNIERICRLNIAACKLKTGDNDGVINECSIVLENNKCFKAYYRMGLALMNKKKYDKAYRYLDNANAIGTAGEKTSVEPHLKECKEKLDEIKKKEREERLKKEKEKEEEEKKKEEEKNKKVLEEKEDKKEEKKENIKNEEKKKEKEDSKIDDSKNVIEKEKENNKQKKEDKEEEKKIEEDDIKVEDSKENKNINNINTSSTYNSNFNNNYNNFNNNFNNQPPHLNQDYINQARNQINNMSDEQLNLMTEQMKSMDNQTLKNMMAAQGMNISDEQIEMMKRSLSPEVLKMMKDPNFKPPNMGNPFNNNINNNNNNNITNNNNINNTNQSGNMPPQMPNFANMDFQQMMDFVKKNPELLKMISPQLSQMMGGKNIDPEVMMKSMEKILWIFSIPGRIKRFMLSWRGVCFIIFIIAIFYGLFRRK